MSSARKANTQHLQAGVQQAGSPVGVVDIGVKPSESVCVIRLAQFMCASSGCSKPLLNGDKQQKRVPVLLHSYRE